MRVSFPVVVGTGRRAGSRRSMDVEDDALNRTIRRAPETRPDADPRWIADGVDVVRPSLQAHRAATARDVTALRREFALWLAVDIAPGDLVDDLVLVVYEALANVVDHAYAGASGPAGTVRLVAHRAELGLRVTVADDGRWQSEVAAPFRSHGLSVMRLLVARLHVARTDSGTVVHLCTALPAPVRRTGC